VHPVDGVPVLRITSVSPGTAAVARRTLRQLSLKGDSLLLVDLRGASAGDYAEAARLAAIFAPPGEAGRLRDRSGEETILKMEGGDKASAGRVAVLIDAGTAGPAELVAQVLKQRRGATLIGSQTNGRASVQSYFPLGDGGVLRLSVARCQGPDGSSWDGTGLTPDRELKWESVETPADASEDEAAVRKALEILRSPAAPAAASAA
jgi:carboxyl-terminal processing protease